MKDGFSTPEKFMFNLLKYINIDFIWQLSKKHKKWCDNKRYDFYFKFNEKEYIIEVHGGQHYNGGFKTLGGKDEKEEKENDLYKYNLAISNGISPENYIVIDCRKSYLSWIRNNILNSKLNEIFNLSDIEWDLIYINSLEDIIFKVNDLYNMNHGVIEISNKLKISRDTVREYLQKCSECGLNNYNKNKQQCSNIECKYGYNNEYILFLYNNKNLSAPKIAKIIGCHEDTIRRRLHKLSKSGLCEYDPEKSKKECKCIKIKNIITNKIYKSFKEASDDTGIPLTTLRRKTNNEKDNEWIKL